MRLGAFRELGPADPRGEAQVVLDAGARCGLSAWTYCVERAALAARALPGLAAATVAGVLGFGASLPAVAALLGVEFLLCAFIVRITATRPEGWTEFNPGHGKGEFMSRAGDRLDAEDRYTTDAASLVRAARAARTG